MKKLLLVVLAVMLFAVPAFADTVDEVDHYMSALVTAADEQGFTVKWADDKEYSFKLSADTDMSDLEDGLQVGDTVFISYTGDIDWEMCDAGDVHVKYMSVGDMDEVDYISGVVTDGSMHNITIKWASGKEYSFFIGEEADKSGLGDEGVGLDKAIKIGYIGSIDWENQQQDYLHVVSLAEGEPETVNEVTGTVYDAAMHSLVLEAEDGTLYGFSDYGDVDKSGLAEGLMVGNKIKVSYVGSLSEIDYVHMTAVSDD